MKLNIKIKSFSLIEILVSITIFSMIVLLSFMILNSSSELYKITLAKDILSSKTAYILLTIVNDFKNVPSDRIIPYDPIDSPYLKFKKVIGLNENGEPILSNYIEWKFEYPKDELDNGIDDNHNHLIDEGNVVRIEYNEDGEIIKKVIYGRNLMERDELAEDGGLNGLSFSRIGNSNKLLISVSLQSVFYLNKSFKILRYNLKTVVNLIEE